MIEREDEILQQTSKNKGIIDKSKWNKSVYFIVPMIGINSGYFNLVNCYLGDNTNRPELNFRRIFLNIKYKDEKLLGIEYYQSFYRLEDNTYMYIFHIPEQFKEDYDLFCAGKYSKFSEDYKKQIIRLINMKPVINSSVYKILHKTSDQRKKIEDMIGQPLKDDEEVCSRPNLDAEIYSCEVARWEEKKED